MTLDNLITVLKDYQGFGYGGLDVIIVIDGKEHKVNFARVNPHPNEKVEITYD